MWLANIAVSLSFPVLLESLGSSVLFLVYAVIGIAAFLFVLKFVPETKGKSLEEIEAEITAKNRLHDNTILRVKFFFYKLDGCGCEG
ncbi:hypothetical protein GCM10020331_083200 [Ectobacillus funiculus]